MSSAAVNPQFLDHYENPYYLHSSDHAGLVLVSDRLSSGAEFHSWKRSIRMALNSDAVIFQTMGSPSESVPTDAHVLAAAQHGYRPKQRPLCTYCGQYGHILQKCFKIHGYPPGHRFHGQTPRGSSSQSMAARGQQNKSGYPRSHHQHQPLQYPPSNTVTNVTNVPMMGSSIPSSSSLDVNRMSQDQVQYILHQLQASVRPPESSVQNQHATITEHGHMAAQSSSAQKRVSHDIAGLDDIPS
ncbi:hypothetical protein YC2023_109722 [Brassica napus]